MPKNFLSNVKLTSFFPDRVIVTPFDSLFDINKRKIFYITFLFSILKEYDGVVIINPSFDWTCRCLLLKILSLGKCKIVFFDMLLSKPQTFSDYLRAFIKRIFFKFIDKFIFLHRDISGYIKYYGIDKNKCVFIPFKANNLHLIDRYKVVDDGYLLSCGASYRDFVLLAKALKHYSCTTTVLLPADKLARYHHSIIDETLFDPNVRIIRHDFNADSWYNILSRCRAVVLPIRSDVIQCAGISVYLEAMAFGKPVIITESPATRDLLSEGTAVICPPDDPVALSEAIKEVMENDDCRSELSRNGYEYVKSLGGEDRLVKDILDVIASM